MPMPPSPQPSSSPQLDPQQRNRRRGRRRALFCPAHPEQRVAGNGKKYFLHLLSAEELRRRGMGGRKARLVIQAYPVLVLSNEWLEELFCPACGSSHWCHVIRHDRVSYTVRWAPRELWEQVAHVDPLMPNPSISEFSLRQARGQQASQGHHCRRDGKRLFDPGR